RGEVRVDVPHVVESRAIAEAAEERDEVLRLALEVRERPDDDGLPPRARGADQGSGLGEVGCLPFAAGIGGRGVRAVRAVARVGRRDELTGWLREARAVQRHDLRAIDGVVERAA